MTYGEVAEKAGYPGAARQVVWALRNSGPAVPWHRVVGAGLRIRLPGEAGLEQQMRLESEGWTDQPRAAYFPNIRTVSASHDRERIARRGMDARHRVLPSASATRSSSAFPNSERSVRLSIVRLNSTPRRMRRAIPRSHTVCPGGQNRGIESIQAVAIDGAHSQASAPTAP